MQEWSLKLVCLTNGWNDRWFDTIDFNLLTRLKDIWKKILNWMAKELSYHYNFGIDNIRFWIMVHVMCCMLLDNQWFKYRDNICSWNAALPASINKILYYGVKTNNSKWTTHIVLYLNDAKILFGRIASPVMFDGLFFADQ